jgi:hypothetical protein
MTARLTADMVVRRTPLNDETLADTPARERRMHLRAHDYWRSLCIDGRPPRHRDFDWIVLDDRGSRSFLCSVVESDKGARIEHVGAELMREGRLEAGVRGLADLPPGSLLHRVLAGATLFEASAEPVMVEGHYLGPGGALKQYRAALLPLVAEDGTGRYVFGTVSWSEQVPVLH